MSSVNRRTHVKDGNTKPFLENQLKVSPRLAFVIMNLASKILLNLFEDNVCTAIALLWMRSLLWRPISNAASFPAQLLSAAPVHICTTALLTGETAWDGQKPTWAHHGCHGSSARIAGKDEAKVGSPTAATKLSTIWAVPAALPQNQKADRGGVPLPLLCVQRVLFVLGLLFICCARYSYSITSHPLSDIWCCLIMSDLFLSFRLRILFRHPFQPPTSAFQNLRSAGGRWPATPHSWTLEAQLAGAVECTTQALKGGC